MTLLIHWTDPAIAPKPLLPLPEPDSDYTGDTWVYYNGAPTRVRDIPDAHFRYGFGVGHWDWKGREVHSGDWPYTPDTCDVDRVSANWNRDGQNLICQGCGVDYT